MTVSKERMAQTITQSQALRNALSWKGWKRPSDGKTVEQIPQGDWGHRITDLRDRLLCPA